ncbi:hypothetical protein RO3G_12584 [Rhizopus delemar RA 99-880]|uniref:Uncharacterized protein n=1 Tax=Rhizopus delemar (strain RA 99-880 / ATCC MYA-4621 / FGSC 9543 / NRRL 43880) TaxID=246409 RepID=I1CHE3_RHIO9|nr:hypothetical protein RO3G_12584 [Rhizopus delemar RA 99-880]|eukprot:EIE87873.1 hypothetical protein RO3G_12584 [Rhizopus delemar RA 99-880]
MRDSLFKMFGSVKLVQEVTRSNQSNTNTTTNTTNSTESHLESSNPTYSTNEPIITTTAIATAIPSTINNNTVNIIENEHTDNSLSMTNSNKGSVQQPIIKQNNLVQKLIHSTHIPTNKSVPNTPKNPGLRSILFTKPTRKNSKYSTRRHRHKAKKAHKLLCLWPLPIVTRCMILIAILVSTLNSLHILDLSCAAPSFVIYRFNLRNVILSPFLFDWTLPSIALYGWNVFILGLFEESLAHMVGGTRRFVELLAVLFATVSSLRLVLGYVFTKSTGWAVPSLFFSNAMHECSQGLAPFLFALLVVQSLSIHDKYILIYGQEDANNNKLTVRKVTLQLIMSLVNYTTKNILWWSVSGLFTGFMITVCLQAFLVHEKREDSIKVKDVNEYITLERYRRTPLWRLIWSAVKKGALIVAVTMPILMTWNAYYTRDIQLSSAQLNTISSNRYLFTLVFMTAPRRGDPAYLTRTIESYLANWPENPPAHSPYYRMQAIIYTHFSNHSQYDLARAHFSNTPKGQQYLKWVREEGSELNQRLHVSKALDLATSNFESSYYALMEDDFPVCGQREWHEIEKVVYKAQKEAPHHCGVFVGTGGRFIGDKQETVDVSHWL